MQNNCMTHSVRNRCKQSLKIPQQSALFLKQLSSVFCLLLFSPSGELAVPSPISACASCTVSWQLGHPPPGTQSINVHHIPSLSWNTKHQRASHTVLELEHKASMCITYDPSAGTQSINVYHMLSLSWNTKHQCVSHAVLELENKASTCITYRPSAGTQSINMYHMPSFSWNTKHQCVSHAVLELQCASHAVLQLEHKASMCITCCP